jgi:stearoyl-CoA desaturase (delta-9 desaturase)
VTRRQIAIVVFIVLCVVLVAAALFAIGGWQFVLWGIFLRIVFSWHATWLVNSAAHVWGSRRFATRDDSRNLWWVALVAFGEGWHNNHHTYPRSAKHGLTWKEIDLNWMQIWTLEKLGLAKNIRLTEFKPAEKLAQSPGDLETMEEVV